MLFMLLDHLSTETEALNVIMCAPETPTAMIEAAGDVCLRAWCRQRGCHETDVARLTVLYLQSEGQDDGRGVVAGGVQQARRLAPTSCDRHSPMPKAPS